MKNDARQASLKRDLGMLLLLLWSMAQALIMALASEEMRMTYLILLLAMDGSILIGYLGRPMVSLALCATITLVWITYRLYGYYFWGSRLDLPDYLLTPVPLVGAAGAYLYHAGMRRLSIEHEMFRQQVEELVLVDRVTGLYNLRALYRDLQVMVNYCERNHLPLTLMELQLRYESELEGMLSANRFIDLRRRLGEVIQNNVRVEDRVYAADEKGSIIVLLTAAEKDNGIIKSRIIHALDTTDAFDGILEAGTKIDLRTACKQYYPEIYGMDMLRYRKAVEAELAYDV